MSIADILHHKGHEVVKARTTDTVSAAVRKMSEHRIGAVIVEDPWMRPVGIFTERDFLNAVTQRGATVLTMPVETQMTAPIITCRPSDAVDQVLGMMTMAKIRHVPVMDEGKLLGIVSIGDLVKHRLDEKMLEADVLLDLARMRA